MIKAKVKGTIGENFQWEIEKEFPSNPPEYIIADWAFEVSKKMWEKFPSETWDYDYFM